jgi:hypothetical protein
MTICRVALRKGGAGTAAVGIEESGVVIPGDDMSDL